MGEATVWTAGGWGTRRCEWTAVRVGTAARAGTTGTGICGNWFWFGMKLVLGSVAAFRGSWPDNEIDPLSTRTTQFTYPLEPDRLRSCDGLARPRAVHSLRQQVPKESVRIMVLVGGV